MEKPFFISYSRDDVDFVRRVANDLGAARIPTWMDRDRLEPGVLWGEELADGLADSAGVILVISPASVRSSWVRQETSYANRLRKRFFPIILERTRLPRYIDFAVGQYQMLDFTSRAHADGVRALVEAIQKHEPEDRQPDEDEAPSEGYPAIHVEDVVEFFHHVPRAMLWRILSLDGVNVWTRVAWIAALRPLSVVGYWIFLFSVLLTGIVAYGIVAGLPLAEIEPAAGLGILAVMALIAAVPALVVALYKAPMKRVVERTLHRIYAWCPHRPIGDAPNILLDHWDRVRPIISQLLDQPIALWEEYIDSRCPDPRLGRRVRATAFILAGADRSFYVGDPQLGEARQPAG